MKSCYVCVYQPKRLMLPCGWTNLGSERENEFLATQHRNTCKRCKIKDWKYAKPRKMGKGRNHLMTDPSPIDIPVLILACDNGVLIEHHGDQTPEEEQASYLQLIKNVMQVTLENLKQEFS